MNGSDAYFTSATTNGTFYIKTVANESSVEVTNMTFASLGKVTYKFTGTGSTVNLYGDSTITVAGSSSSALDVADFQVALAGASSLTKVGIGKLQLDVANPDFTGTLNMQLGTLVVNNVNALQNSTLNFTNGALSFNTQTAATFGGLSGGKTFALSISGNTVAVALSVGNNNATTTYSGVMSGIGTLTKIGSGKLTLTGANTYTGATTISDGTLALVNNGSIASSASIDVANGATLKVSDVTDGFSLASGQTLKGNGSVVGDVTIASGATLAPGNSIGALTFDSNVTLANGSTTLMEIGASSSDLISVGGALALDGTLKVTDDGTVTYAAGQSWDLFDASSFSGSFSSYDLPTLAAGLSWNTSAVGTTGEISIVPEPTTAVMLLSGLLGLIAYAWRKRK
ncbi:MAG: autotransporter-associated beta strand repeat-containing protein [Planctomycetaceae bacterium]|nr:autotransporter-associated beta strand repeat-containing protein [Planctomycetaceae bacterium]